MSARILGMKENLHFFAEKFANIEVLHNQSHTTKAARKSRIYCAIIYVETNNLLCKNLGIEQKIFHTDYLNTLVIYPAVLEIITQNNHFPEVIRNMY